MLVLDFSSGRSESQVVTQLSSVNVLFLRLTPSAIKNMPKNDLFDRAGVTETVFCLIMLNLLCKFTPQMFFNLQVWLWPKLNIFFVIAYVYLISKMFVCCSQIC